MKSKSEKKHPPKEQARAPVRLPHESGGPFGSEFFLRQLGGLVRDHCPGPGEALPAVRLHLADGETLDLCHIIGIAPTWAALAVLDEAHQAVEPTMRTELVPYSMILRITVRAVRHGETHVGFDIGREPGVLKALREQAAGAATTPEAVLRAVAGAPPSARSGTGRAKP